MDPLNCLEHINAKEKFVIVFNYSAPPPPLDELGRRGFSSLGCPQLHQRIFCGRRREYRRRGGPVQTAGQPASSGLAPGAGLEKTQPSIFCK
jgi:hypothetical protein